MKSGNNKRLNLAKNLQFHCILLKQQNSLEETEEFCFSL
ncbi:hypothetical protein MHA_2676 [Mannheimia haemolytica PHL213]|nr:hypothetical protein MHH_c21100 [Mannheimia haemolytica M42548]EDN75542.1 hypothetical protein MHA_2676 [Mannheimia haemolytica PHL213]